MLPAMLDVRAVSFDLDDTLVDDTGCYQQSIEGVCADLGPPFDAAVLGPAYDAVSTTWWPSGDLMAIRTRLWSEALGACGYDTTLAPRVVERYLHHRVHTAKVLTGAMELLEALRSKYRLAVITNGGGDIQRLRLAHLGLDEYFDAIVASTDVDAGKPDRRIFDHASKLLGVPAGETWHVGDSLASDVAGALNAGLQAAVWYNCNGAVCRDEDAQPHFQIATLSELLPLLGGH
jgi:putative hydrolase of the HAD superfamily